MPADLSRRAGDAVRELVSLGALRSAWIDGMSDDMRYRPPRDAGANPDTDDPLTVFGLLLLAREAWGEPVLYVGTAHRWYVSVPDDAAPRDARVMTGATEAEAVVAVLEAAVEARRA